MTGVEIEANSYILIMHKLVEQHDDIRQTLLNTDLDGLIEDTLPDVYWSSKLPSFWLSIQQELKATPRLKT